MTPQSKAADKWHADNTKIVEAAMEATGGPAEWEEDLQINRIDYRQGDGGTYWWYKEHHPLEGSEWTFPEGSWSYTAVVGNHTARCINETALRERLELSASSVGNFYEGEDNYSVSVWLTDDLDTDPEVQTRAPTLIEALCKAALQEKE